MENKTITPKSKVYVKSKSKSQIDDKRHNDKLTLSLLSKTSMTNNEENEKNQYNTISNNKIPNFFNEMNTIYDQEKENLINQILVYQQELESRKSLMEDQQNIYQNKLKEIQEKYKTDFELLQSQYESQSAQLVNEKEEQINVLVNNNKELIRCNEELFLKNNNYLDMMNKIKNTLNENIYKLETENTRQRNEKDTS